MKIIQRNITSFGLIRPSSLSSWVLMVLFVSVAVGSPPVENLLVSNASFAQADQDDDIEAFRNASPLVLPLLVPDEVPAPFEGAFSVDEQAVVGIIGGTDAVEMSNHGYLDTLLGINGMPMRSRNLAWEADTVYQQYRPRSFYTEHSFSDEDPDVRQRQEIDLFIVWLGQAESLDASQSCDKFRQKYERIVRLLQTYSGKIVLVTPVPFENPLKLPFNIDERNANLSNYAAAIRQIGEEKGLLVVDLFTGLSAQSKEVPLTTDGLRLNDRGHWIVAQEFTRQLGLADAGDSLAPNWPNAALSSEEGEACRQLAIWRNSLWHRYWRPTNWAFLYGNRQRSFSSRDHRDKDHRWFPGEIETILPSLAEAEVAFQKSVEELQSNLQANN